MNKNIQKLHRRIQNIEIQGATNVAAAVVRGLRDFADQLKGRTSREFVREIATAGKFLAGARDTEPMADNAVEFMIHYLNKNINRPATELAAVARDAGDYFLEVVSQNDRKIARAGEKLIRFGDRIFTHCHASAVMGILKSAKTAKKRFEVFQTETRPLFQGHRTARELIGAGIKDTLVIDSAAPYLISKISGPKFAIDKVIIGCDAIARDGSCVNKVGSFSLALTAFLNKIPVYVATQSLKMNEDAKNERAIKIEEREAKEIWPSAPRGLKIYNPAFDLVPSELITAYITEFGLVKPDNLFVKVKKEYPWVLE